MAADYPTSAEALRFAGLDYQVIKSPIFTKPEGLQVSDSGGLEPLSENPVPLHFATLRSDLNIPLGVVGKEYKIIQNADAFSFFDAIVADGKGINYIRDILGHESVTTTEVYAKVDSKQKREAIEKAYVGVVKKEAPIWVKNESLLEWLKNFK